VYFAAVRTDQCTGFLQVHGPVAEITACQQISSVHKLEVLQASNIFKFSTNQ
jgi:hypothetical protein